MTQAEKKIRIVLTGGGTGGSVTPLLAVAEDLIARYADNLSIVWIGMSSGVERTMTAGYPFDYKAISAGKLRRYFSWKNFFDPLRLLLGFIQSFFILLTARPRLVMTAGSFISVPVIWAAWLLRIPSIIHQQDIRPGLANKLMAPFVSVVTVVFEKSLGDYGKKAVLTGNPIRSAFSESFVENNETKPILLILGGGTGSETINNLIYESLDTLTRFCKIIHVTGKPNVRSSLQGKDTGITDYECYDLLDTVHMAKAMQRASVVVTRAGLGFLSELSFLGKATVIIPIPKTQQEDNAAYFEKQGAAIVLDQKNLDPRQFTLVIQNLLNDKAKLAVLREHIKQVMRHDANSAIMNIIEKYIN
jgi:UDP-N-acetylglucosamine--N-acetylmuramyl-(pentapeptide) pyrophosphoryl-undecaprenol N-acetylglucosamine transferase